MNTPPASTDSSQRRRDPRRLVRPHEGRIIAGVAAGIADRLEINPWIVRIAFVGSTVFGGAGLLLYLAGWALIPEEGAPQAPAERLVGRLGDWTTWIGAGLVLVATAVLVAEAGLVRADIVWAVALLTSGVLLYRGGFAGMTEPDQPLAPPPETTGPEDDEGVEDQSAEKLPGEPVEEGGPPPSSDPDRETAVIPVPPSPRPRSLLGRLTIGAALITLGAMLLLDTAGLVRPAFSHYVAASVGVVGVGLLVGSVLGRSRGLIAVGIVLLPVLFVSSALTANFEGGFGDPTYRPVDLADLRSEYELTGGDLVLDLRRLELGGEWVEVEGDVGFGRLLVLVPPEMGIDVTAHVGFGDIETFNTHEGGIDVDRSFFRPGQGGVRLNLDVGFGTVQVRAFTTDDARITRIP